MLLHEVRKPALRLYGVWTALSPHVGCRQLSHPRTVHPGRFCVWAVRSICNTILVAWHSDLLETTPWSTFAVTCSATLKCKAMAAGRERKTQSGASGGLVCFRGCCRQDGKSVMLCALLRSKCFYPLLCRSEFFDYLHVRCARHVAALAQGALYVVIGM